MPLYPNTAWIFTPTLFVSIIIIAFKADDMCSLKLFNRMVNLCRSTLYVFRVCQQAWCLKRIGFIRTE